MAKQESVDYGSLVAKAIQGDAQAYEELYAATSRQMYGLAWSMLRDEQDVQDILQESYLYAFKALEQLEQPAYFGTWLYRIVSNRCKNHLTRTRPKLFAASLTDEDGDDWDLEDDDIAFRPDESVDYAETKRLVREMVQSLPEDQRMCVMMFYFQDMKVGQIAQLLEVSENTVKSRLNYARKKIKSLAEELERKGTILHSVGALPFLRWALESGIADAFSSAQVPVLQNILQGAEAVGTVASTAAEAATVAEAAVEGASAVGGTAATTKTFAATATTSVKAFLGTMGGKIAAVAMVATVAIGGVTLLTPEPEPDPEPLPVVTPQPELEPQIVFVFDETFPDQNGIATLEDYHMRVEISEPATVYEFDIASGDVYIGLEVGDTVVIRYSGPGEQWRGLGPVLQSNLEEDWLIKTNDDWYELHYEVVAEGTGTVACNWTSQSGSYVEANFHISVPGTPPEPEPVYVAQQPVFTPVEIEVEEYVEPPVVREPEPFIEPDPEPEPEPIPEPEPEPEEEGDFYPVSYQFRNSDGSTADITFMGIEIDDTYSVILDNVVLKYRNDTYRDLAAYQGLEILSVSEAESMGLLENVSYGGGKLSFTTSADKYNVLVQHEETGLYGYGQPGTYANHHVFEFYYHDQYGANIRKLRSS